MCRGCGRVRIAKSALNNTMTIKSTPESYRTEVEVLIIYSGSQDIRVVGCRSGNRYIFKPGVTRTVDANDALCLIEMNGFSYG
jgi:hypothetical protein